jgi:hypothetical protein
MRLEFRLKNFVDLETIVAAELRQRMFQGDLTST